MRLNLLARSSCRNPPLETSRLRLTTADTHRRFPFPASDSQSQSRSAENTSASFDRLSCDLQACSWARKTFSTSMTQSRLLPEEIEELRAEWAANIRPRKIAKNINGV